MKLIFYNLFLILLLNCTEKSLNEEASFQKSKLEVQGADFSFLPEVRQSGQNFYNQNGVSEDMLTTFYKSGGNTVRLRLWVDPNSSYANLYSVKNLSQEIKSKGMNVLLALHYSDDWADPNKQTKPSAWKNLSFSSLKQKVFTYTQTVIQEIQPDYVQIGNEINSGFLWPEGHITNQNQMVELLESGILAVRSVSNSISIIMHYAGYIGASYFYSIIKNLDYDIVGISYYPIWHGKNLSELQKNLIEIQKITQKKILIVETAYPFTLSWNDNTNNIVGLENQLIPGFPASENGQKNFLIEIQKIMKNIPKGMGFIYWGAEWTSYKGNSSNNGSTWENQAFWNFENVANPVLNVYQ